ncbi:MAG: sigma-70 family RNA polymerase sigma factor [Planctomycetes bacterium]|nr:sigma-70 family RNA polymerase sigma factor [Planctomycetota bacterium]
MRAFCWSHAGNVPDALDLTQEVFLRAYQKLPALKKPERFGIWLFTVSSGRSRPARHSLSDMRTGSRSPAPPAA